MVYGWYHPATVADNSTPAEYRQSPNDLQTLGAAYAGMVNAITAGRANLSLVDMGEVYSGTGAAFYKGFAEYRRNTVQNNLPTLSAAGRAAYSSIIQIGFMRFANYSLTTTSASGVTQELGEMWPYMTANGISGYYDESNFTQIPGFITDGVKAFNDAGRR